MNVNLKFNLDEIVYFIHLNKVKQAKIICIRVNLYSKRKSEPYIEYVAESNGINFSFNDKELFKTKKELLETL